MWAFLQFCHGIPKVGRLFKASSHPAVQAAPWQLSRGVVATTSIAAPPTDTARLPGSPLMRQHAATLCSDLVSWSQVTGTLVSRLQTRLVDAQVGVVEKRDGGC
jgi:hypothetical protein